MTYRNLLLFVLSLSLLNTAVFPAHILAAEEKAAAKPAEGGEGGKKSKDSTSDVSGGRFAGDPIYVHLQPIVLPVINDKGVEQLVTIVLDVEVKNFDASDSIHSNMPRVRDSLMRALYGGLGTGTLRNGKLVDVIKVKTKAVAAIGDVIGVENVRDVLVEAVGQRML